MAGRMRSLSPSRTETKTVPSTREIDAGAELRLGECQRVIGVEAHDFAGRAHFRAEQRIDAGEAGEREDGFLDRDVLERARVGLLAIAATALVELFASHDAGGDLGDRRADGLGDEGHGARGRAIDFEDVDRAVLDRELDVHQAADVQRLGENLGLALQFVHHLVRQRVNGQRAGAIARVNAGSFDMLMMPETKTSLPSQRQSTSTSIALVR